MNGNKSEVSPDVLANEMQNINKNLSEFKETTNKDFQELKEIIKEWKQDVNKRIESVDGQINILYDYHEQSKDDRRELHRLCDANAANSKVLEKDVADLKTNLTILSTMKVETNGFKKGLDNISKVITTLASVIVSLGVIVAFSYGLFIVFKDLPK